MDVKKRSARGIGCIGRVHLATGQAPQQKGIHRAKGQIAFFGALAGALHVIENPGDLGGTEIRIQQQASAGVDFNFMTSLAQLLAGICRAPVLPDNCVVYRLTTGAIPYHGSFALVGDAYTGESALCPGKHLLGDSKRR